MSLKDSAVCIVCGEMIWWRKTTLPPACGDHEYVQVVDSYEKKLRAQKRKAKKAK